MQQPPPSGYGPHPHGYGPQGYGYPPPKRGMSFGTIAVLIFVGLMAFVMIVSAIASGGAEKRKAEAAAAASASAAKAEAAAASAAADAKAKKDQESLAVFPTKKSDINDSITAATKLVAQKRWLDADEALGPAERILDDFRRTPAAQTQDFKDLDTKADRLRAQIDPSVKPLRAEKELKASSIAVSAVDLFEAYHANEIAADERYKGQKLLVTGTVDGVDKGPFGGFYLRLATTNMFMPIHADMEQSEKSQLMQTQKGERARVLCTCRGMVLGTPTLGDCTFR